LPKIDRLSPERYVLVTSLPLNPNDKDKISVAVHPHIRMPEDILGAEDLNNLLGLHPEIEQQHFKLWMSSTAVLERVLYNAEKVQTDFDIERIQRMIPRYVQTGSYPRAMEILAERRFVIISGVPGIGKTTLANMLLFAHLEASYQPVVIQSSIAEGKAQFKKDTHQIFYFDDFLGDTFLGNRLFDFLGKKEDSVILSFMELIATSKYSRLIVTTREHILRHAFQVSEHFRRHRLDLAMHRCILEIGDYTLLERGRILYNHIYFSDLPEAYRLELLRDEFYIRILKHPNYNPRLVEWLSRYTNVKGVLGEGYQARVEWILEHPEELWRIAFEQQISEASRSAILALYSLSGKAPINRLEEAWRALHQYRAKKYNCRTAAEDWRQSLQDLEGGFLNFKDEHAEFVNPSVKDFLDMVMTQSVDHYNDLLASSCRFEQVVVLWNLVTSPKGKSLLARITRSPDLVLSAMSQNLQRPHEETGSGGYAIRQLDARPELRLKTLISVADHTRSDAALTVAVDYAGTVIKLWEKTRANCRAATEVLSVIDGSEWSAIANAALHAELKSTLLHSVGEWSRGRDIAAIADYGLTQK
jgi:hypothetical protein